MKLLKAFLICLVTGTAFGSAELRAQDSIAGTYRAVLDHEQSDFYQFATITLRTVNPGDGTLKISANVRILFGDWNSNEFLTYEFPDCPMNIITRQISIKSDDNDVSFVGYLRNGEIKGSWNAAAVGEVGKFAAMKPGTPPVPANKDLVKTATGHYKGKLTNTNPDSNLPERVTLSLVTTQETSDTGPVLKISGNLRFYLGEFGSTEYVETKLSSVQFNFYSRYLTVKTESYGITLKGTMDLDGVFTGDVFADGLGKVGTIEVGVPQ